MLILTLLAVSVAVYAALLGYVVASTTAWDAHSVARVGLLAWALIFSGYAAAFEWKWGPGDEATAVLPVAPAEGAPPPLHWSGRPLRQGIMTLGFVLFVFFLVLFVETLTGSGGAQSTIVILLILALLVAASAIVAGASRVRSLVIDESGMRFHRPLLRDVDIRWADVGLVGRVAATPTALQARQVGPSQCFLVFRGRDGRRLGTLSPFAELTPEGALRVVALIEAHARSRGIPFQDVSPLDLLLRWRGRGPTPRP